MLSIGWRNLKQERLRAVTAVVGVAFSVLLVCVEIGMLLGLTRSASLLIDTSHADLWVSAKGIKTFDFATPIERRTKELVRTVPGVARVEEYFVSYSLWKLPSGVNVNCQLIGIEEGGSLAPELKIKKGNFDSLHNQDAVVIDSGECLKLGDVQLGDQVELIGKRAKIVGLTQAMRSFTTTPYVFTTLKRARKYSLLANPKGGGSAFYFLVKVESGVNIESVRNAIGARIAGVEVLTTKDFSTRTRMYWLFETGVGLGFLAAAFLGLLVGVVIVSQTLYAMTVDRISEFAILKALGGRMGELSRVVLEQGLLCGAGGLLLGLVVSFVIADFVTRMGTIVELPWELLAAVTVLTFLLCVCASFFSIAKLGRLEPVAVFRA